MDTLKARRILLVAAGGVAAVILLLACLAFVIDLVITTPEDREFRSRFGGVAPGISEAEVVNLLGPPDERSREFFLAQRSGFEDAYRRAAESGSAYFLVWHREIDLVYSVGIDSDGNVTLAEVGGT
jgi:hypothetical protein